MNTHTGQHFARVLGCEPRVSSIRWATKDRLDKFVEVFGPPETFAHKGDRLLFWNFADHEGKSAFSLFCLTRRWSMLRRGSERRIDLVTADTTSPVVSRLFSQWVIDRLCDALNGDAPPVFVLEGAALAFVGASA